MNYVVYKRLKHMRKIDIHCHIIPGLDDGAADLNESLEMLKIAWAQGFDTFIATPHYSLHYQNLCPELIREQCSLLEEKARSAVCPEIRIYPGQEICYEDDTMKKLEQGRLLTLADSSYVLTEFPYHILFAELYRSLQRLRLEGYIPILAHAERYRSIRENEESLEELTEAGVLIQLNYESLERSLADRSQRWCRRQLKDGRVHFLGTDMHNTSSRLPQTERACAWMNRHLDKEKQEALCYGNAEKLLKNESIL